MLKVFLELRSDYPKQVHVDERLYMFSDSLKVNPHLCLFSMSVPACLNGAFLYPPLHSSKPPLFSPFTLQHCPFCRSPNPGVLLVSVCSIVDVWLYLIMTVWSLLYLSCVRYSPGGHVTEVSAGVLSSAGDCKGRGV